MCLTPTAVLIFKIDTIQNSTVLHLKEVRKLETLELIKRQGENHNVICFIWKKAAKGAYKDDILTNDVFLIPNADVVIENFIRVMVQCGASVDNNTHLKKIKDALDKDPEAYTEKVTYRPSPSTQPQNKKLKFLTTFFLIFFF